MASSEAKSQHQQEVAFACSVLQKADSDTKKLAALLVVGKLFAERPLFESDKSKLLELIGCDFLLKLLNNHLRQLSCSTSERNDCDASFSLDIVVHFIPSIVRDFEQNELFFEILGQILFANFNADKSKYDRRVTDNVIDCFYHVNNSVAHLDKHQIDLLVANYLNYILKSYLVDIKHDDGARPKLENLMIDFSKAVNGECFNLFIDKICGQFQQSKSLDKFKLCQLLKLILQNQSATRIALDKVNWPQYVRDSLFEILKNKLNTQYRDDALGLATQMMLTCDGIHWIKCGQWDEVNSKFFILLLRLVCIEIQLLLPRYFAEGKYECDKVGNSLILLEQLIFAFINNLENDEAEEPSRPIDMLKIDSNTIVSSINAIREAMRKVIEFIKEVSQQPPQQITGKLLQLVVASIRLLCAYLTEENNVLVQEVAEVLPFILNVVNKNNSNTEMEGIKPHLMATVRQLYEDETMKTIFVQHNIQMESIDEE